MNELLLVGGGGHCRACIDVIEAQGQYQVAGIVQPLTDGQDAVLCYPVLGDDDDLPALLAQTPNALVTVGQIKSPEIRMWLFNLLKRNGAHLPVIQSPTAYSSRHATLGEGSILMHASLINANAKAREQLGWVPRIGFEAMVEEMMREDLKEAERDALCAKEGFSVLRRHE